MSRLVLALVPVLVLFGAINTIRTQDAEHTYRQRADEGETVFMFIGEVLIGLLYLVQYLRRDKNEESVYSEKKQAPEWLVLFPAIMDLFSTLLSYIALNMVDSSVWQISRGGNIITTALLSRCFLKRTFSPSSILGCFMAFLGITGVQVVAVISDSSSGTGQVTTEVIGILLLLASIAFNSCGLVYQKWIFNKYEMSPLKMVFLEGLYGLIFMVPLTIGFQYISCPWDSHSQCVQTDSGYYLENINKFWDEIMSSTLLFYLNMGLILSIAISVPIAVTVSKKISPVSRSLADVCRTLIIWLFGIWLTLTYGQDQKEYHIEDTSVLVNILKAVGFLVLILGTLLYHDLLPLPCLKRSEIDHGESLLESESQGDDSFIKKQTNK